MSFSMTWTFEELGVNGQKYVDCELIFDADPGEPMVMYERDGSGSPGYAPSADLVGVKCLVFGNFDEVEQPRDQNWFPVLDRIIFDLASSRWDDLERFCLESLDERD